MGGRLRSGVAGPALGLAKFAHYRIVHDWLRLSIEPPTAAFGRVARRSDDRRDGSQCRGPFALMAGLAASTPQGCAMSLFRTAAQWAIDGLDYLVSGLRSRPRHDRLLHLKPVTAER